MDAPLFTVYVRRHCHLCVQMVRALEPLRHGHGFALELVDVDDDPVLAARYGDKVPVLCEGETELCCYVLDVEALRARLPGGYESETDLRTAGRYQRIYAIARQIPAGRVATYGQLAAIEGYSTARMVGYAMAALPAGSDVPWQRVINSRGELSERRGGGGCSEQRRRLEHEGVRFDARGRVSLRRVGWLGPDPAWLARGGFERVSPRWARAAAS